jgi:hypothetical protein
MATFAETLLRLERLFQVHGQVGLDTPYTDQRDKVVGSGPRDPDFAPCGEPYVKITSFGQDPDLPADANVMFQSHGIAISWWIDEVHEYATRVKGDGSWTEDESLHLYWRVMPEFHCATYLLMDQAGAVRTRSPLAAMPQIELGFVQCEMLISKLGPDGKEG